MPRFPAGKSDEVLKEAAIEKSEAISLLDRIERDLKRLKRRIAA
jgi:hypothetical protein